MTLATDLERRAAEIEAQFYADATDESVGFAVEALAMQLALAEMTTTRGGVRVAERTAPAEASVPSP